MTKPDNEIKITNQIKIYENKYGALYDDEIEFLPQKIKGTYVRWSWNVPYSVAVLPMISPDTGVLIRSFRHSARKLILEVPKGFGEKNKEPVEIAKMELKEETGLICGAIDYKGMVFTDPAFAYHPMHLFIAWDCLEGQSNNEESEVIFESVPLKINHVDKLFSEGLLQDAITLLLVRMAQDYKRGKDEKN